MGRVVWLVIAIFGLILSSLTWDHRSLFNTEPRIKISSASSIPYGREKKEEPKRKEFDLAFYPQLEKTFPDWEERMVYQLRLKLIKCNNSS